MSTFTFIPEYGSPVTTKPRVRVAQFGDGYAQRVGDGINNKPRSWSLTFKGSTAEIDVIESFLITRGGVESFDWLPPSGGTGKWLCGDWTRNPIQYGEESLSTIFQEVFGD